MNDAFGSAQRLIDLLGEKRQLFLTGPVARVDRCVHMSDAALDSQ